MEWGMGEIGRRFIYPGGLAPHWSALGAEMNLGTCSRLVSHRGWAPDVTRDPLPSCRLRQHLFGFQNFKLKLWGAGGRLVSGKRLLGQAVLWAGDVLPGFDGCGQILGPPKTNPEKIAQLPCPMSGARDAPAGSPPSEKSGGIGS